MKMMLEAENKHWILGMNLGNGMKSVFDKPIMSS